MSYKQAKLKRIGKFRHLAFDKLLWERFLKEKWFLDIVQNRPIIRDYVVFDVSAGGIDAIVFDRKRMKPLEVYELTNYTKFRLGNLKYKKVHFPPFYTQKQIKKAIQKQRRRFQGNPYSRVAKGNVQRHVNHLKGFNCKRYVVFSYEESLTEYALWEYAKNGILIKIMNYQD